MADMTLEGSESILDATGKGQAHMCRNRDEAVAWIEERRVDDIQSIVGPWIWNLTYEETSFKTVPFHKLEGDQKEQSHEKILSDRIDSQPLHKMPAGTTDIAPTT